MGMLGVAISYLVVQVLLFAPINGMAYSIIGLRTRDVASALKRLVLPVLEVVAALYILRVALEDLTSLHGFAILAIGAVLGTGLYVVVFWLVEPELLRRMVRLPAELRKAARKKPPTAASSSPLPPLPPPPPTVASPTDKQPLD
jgi:hypothetical protein